MSVVEHVLWSTSRMASPLHLGHIARLKAATCLELVGGVAVEQQVLVDELDQNQSDKLAHVLPANQLLISTGKKNTDGVRTRLREEERQLGKER